LQKSTQDKAGSTVPIIYLKRGEKMIFYEWFPVVIAAVAVAMDLKTAKVDNGWILFSLGLGLLLRILTRGLWGVWLFLTGGLFPILCLGLLFQFRMLGAGDIKLFCAIGGILGIYRVSICMMVSLFIGACIAVALMVSNGSFHERFAYFENYIRTFIQTRECRPYYQNGMSAPENFHFTVPVLLSVLLCAGGVI
jgi:prepilin peptidase CpaA